MANLNRFSKFILFIAFLSGSFWLGSYAARLSVTYQFFEETGFVLKPYYNTGNLSEIFLTIFPLFTSTFITYIIFIVSFIIFLLTSKINLKMNGWLFIVTIMILVTFPFEVYLMTIDWEIISIINSGSFNPNSVIELIKERFTIFSSFPVIEIFCYFAIIFLIIYKPLVKQKTVLNEN